MQDVFEPMANFGGDVFEPMANFGGEVFEPMNFEGEYSNFVDPNLIVQGIGMGIQGAGSIAQAKAQKESSKSDERKFVDNLCGTRTNFANKKKRESNKKCRQDALNQFNKIKDKDRDFQQQQISLQKASLDSDKSKKELEAKNKRNLILGLSIGGGVLILGTILLLTLRKK